MFTQANIREKTPHVLATLTFLFAGYGIGHITATAANLLIGG